MQKRSAESKTKSTSSRPTAAKPKKTTVKELDLVGVQLKPSQQDYFQQIQKNEITFCSGPAGTSKTFTACFTPLHLLATKQVSKIILCKPIQESGEKLGFLPGDIADKIDPYMQSYISNFKKIVGDELTEGLISSGAIEFKPLAFMRGDTFDDAFMILDEAQNAQWHALILFITRMGKNSKVLVTGDISQYDIAKDKVSFHKFIKIFSKVRGVGVHEFTTKDIVRAKILQDIVNIYDKWKDENNL
jgi:phosphate starvation-inducible PhoH-like protein